MASASRAPSGGPRGDREHTLSVQPIGTIGLEQLAEAVTFSSEDRLDEPNARVRYD